MRCDENGLGRQLRRGFGRGGSGWLEGGFFSEPFEKRGEQEQRAARRRQLDGHLGQTGGTFVMRRILVPGDLSFAMVGAQEALLNGQQALFPLRRAFGAIIVRVKERRAQHVRHSCRRNARDRSLAFRELFEARGDRFKRSYIGPVAEENRREFRPQNRIPFAAAHAFSFRFGFLTRSDAICRNLHYRDESVNILTEYLMSNTQYLIRRSNP